MKSSFREMAISTVTALWLTASGCSSQPLKPEQMPFETIRSSQTVSSPKLKEFWRNVRYKLAKVVSLKGDKSFGALSVVKLVDDKGHHHTVGLTAAHVIKDQPAVQLVFANVDGTLEVKIVPGSDFESSTHADVAMVLLPGNEERILPHVDAVTDGEEGIPDEVCLAGFPLSSGHELQTSLVRDPLSLSLEGSVMRLQVPPEEMITPGQKIALKGMSGGVVDVPITGMIIQGCLSGNEGDITTEVRAMVLHRIPQTIRSLLDKLIRKKRTRNENLALPTL